MSERTGRLLANAVLEMLSALLWWWFAHSLLGLGRDASFTFGFLGLLSAEIKNRIVDFRAELRESGR